MSSTRIRRVITEKMDRAGKDDNLVFTARESEYLRSPEGIKFFLDYEKEREKERLEGEVPREMLEDGRGMWQEGDPKGPYDYLLCPICKTKYMRSGKWRHNKNRVHVYAQKVNDRLETCAYKSLGLEKYII